ncbi:MAG: pyridoxal-phosphate dependent enzyme, partial [Pseudomonadota bacterium]
QVMRAGDTYEQSMHAAQEYAQETGAILLSDSAWHGYTERPYAVMEGYTALMYEVGEEIASPPSHIFVQAGVGGLAGAVAAYARKLWGADPKIIVVEPEFAPALMQSVIAGKPVKTSGPISNMGRLDCKEPSLIALKGLARDADFFMTITEDEARTSRDIANDAGFASTTSGTAGIAGLLVCDHTLLQLDSSSRVLCFVSEEA